MMVAEDSITDSAPRLLIVCDEEGDPHHLVQRTLAAGYEVETARGVNAACAALRQPEFSVMLADLSVADDAALTVVRAARRPRPAPLVITLLPRRSDDAALVLALLREVAYVCLRHPVDLEELDELLAAACAQVGQERLASRPPTFQRGAREIARWQQVQIVMEQALVVISALGPVAGPGSMATAADEVGADAPRRT